MKRVAARDNRSASSPAETVAIKNQIDNGKFLDLEQQPERIEALSGALGFILRAEFELYFDHLDNAEEFLQAAKPELQKENPPLDILAEYQSVCGELAYWRYDYKTAEEKFFAAKATYGLTGDQHGVSKALYNLGRLRRRQERFDEALACLDQALEYVGPNLFLKGLIQYNMALCLRLKGHVNEADPIYIFALRSLKHSEGGRYYGVTLDSYGNSLYQIGKFDQSREVFEKAAGLFQRLGTFEDISNVQNNLAQCLIVLKQYDRAENLLRECYELTVRVGNLQYAALTCVTYAELFFAKGDLDQAEKFANESITQAELADDELAKAEAQIILSRILIKKENFAPAREFLSKACEVAQRIETKFLEVQAVLYLAEIQSWSDAEAAQKNLKVVRGLLDQTPYVSVQNELARVQRDLDRKTLYCKEIEENRLIVNLNEMSWSEVKNLINLIQVKLLKIALEESGGCESEAARRLNISRQSVYNWRIKHNL